MENVCPRELGICVCVCVRFENDQRIESECFEEN